MPATPRGIRNNNPLNLRKSNNQWLGKVAKGTDPAFEQFVSMEYGIRAAFVNSRTIIRRNPGIDVRRFIAIWAPPSENNTVAYVSQVCQLAVIAPTQLVEFSRRGLMTRLLWAMAYVETGRKLDFSLFETAYEMV